MSDEARPAEELEAEAAALAAALAGEPVWFVVDGRRWGIRFPGTEEYDDAVSLQSLARRRALAAPEVQAVRHLPASDEEREMFAALLAANAEQLKVAGAGSPERRRLQAQRDHLERRAANRTLADEQADERALLARDRYLTLRLLVDEAGRPVFDPFDPETAAAWERFPMRIKNAARSAVWLMIHTVDTLPFASAPPAGSS